MDNVRGEFSGQDGTDVAPSDIAASPARKPASDERRMQVRAYNFWASLLGEKTFPDIADLDPANLPDFGPRSVLLDFSRGGIENPAVAYVGSALAQECGATDTIESLAQVPGGSLLSRITDHYMQILANEAPIGFEAEYLNARGITILYRGILMPFSRTGDRIDYIYGVINWKESAEPLPQRARPDTEEPAILRTAEPLTDWADGPADFVLPIIDDYLPIDLPEPGFAFETGLADCLASARDLALRAARSEERSHIALYEAIGRAYDVALVAEDHPGELAELLEDAGLEPSSRAPLLPLLKLIFGANYDKTRLAEFASCLAYAKRTRIGRGALCAHLADFPGGLKAIVRAERDLRRVDGDGPRPGTRERMTQDLRNLEPRPFNEIATEGEEFTVIVARRLESGEIVVVGEIGDDEALLRQAAKRLLK